MSRQPLSASNTSGSIHVALTRQTTSNSQRRSTRCSIGTVTHEICFSYLADVPSSDDPRSEDSKFRKSRWFTRGWTLQELIALLHVTFFGDDWVEIGTKSSLQEVILDNTGVSPQVLLMNHAGDISVAQWMAWASGRETTKVEDKVYCLMGFYGVSMPVMYGEGNNAFRRLQLEIMKLLDDHSIFSWTTEASQDQGRGLLARCPEELADYSDVTPHPHPLPLYLPQNPPHLPHRPNDTMRHPQPHCRHRYKRHHTITKFRIHV